MRGGHLRFLIIVQLSMVVLETLPMGKGNGEFHWGWIPFAQAELTDDDRRLQAFGLEFYNAKEDFSKQKAIAIDVAKQDFSKFKWGAAAKDIAGAILTRVIEKMFDEESPDLTQLRTFLEAARKLGVASRDLLPVLDAHKEELSKSGLEDLTKTVITEVNTDTDHGIEVMKSEGIGETAKNIKLVDEEIGFQNLVARDPAQNGEGEKSDGANPAQVAERSRSQNRTPSGINQKPILAAPDLTSKAK